MDVPTLALALLVRLAIALISHCTVQARAQRLSQGTVKGKVQIVDQGVPRYLEQGVQSVEIGTSREYMHLQDGLHQLLDHPSKHILLVRTANNSSDDGQQYNEGSGNCTNPRHPPQNYKSSCEFVRTECAEKAELIDYIAFVVCDLTSVQPIGFIVMAIWAIYLISLLATTVDIFFVPPLTFLADKLNLSPSIAGITLLALGNGAPDIFVAFSGIIQDDLALVLGALTGGGIFITTVVLGSVILVSKVRPFNLDGIDFVRDVLAFMCVVAAIVAVAFDGKVYLLEACLLPLFYIAYITIVITMSYIRILAIKRMRNQKFCSFIQLHIMARWKKKKESAGEGHITDDDSARLVQRMDHSETSTQPVIAATFTHSILVENIIKEPAITNGKDDEKQLLTKKEDDGKYSSNYLPGLSWPYRAHWTLKVIWFIQWPFSLIRWMTIPSFGHNGQWSKWHYIFTAFSPVPMSLLLLLAVKGLKGFTLTVGPMPLPAILVLLGLVPSVTLFILLRCKKPPHWSLKLTLVPTAFIMAVVWLNLEANEIVSILRAFGLLLNVDTAILGLTVLALGNCAADWVADTVVARAGKPEMAIASCFGSPMLSHVLGLSIAMIVKIVIFGHGQPYHFQFHSPLYSEVKFSWIFLGLSLLVNFVFIPLFRFSPPKFYGLVLMSIYTVFVVLAVLVEVGVLPVKF